VQFNSTGGIFLRLDASGNLNIYNSSGTSIAKFVGGSYSNILAKGTNVNNVPITTTVSTTDVLAGLSIQITPQISTSILFIAEFDTVSNSIATDGIRCGVYFQAGSLNPAGGTAITGWSSAALGNFISATANASGTVTVTGLITGLTAGTAYTLATSAAAVTGGTATIGTPRILAFEL
jgi:hypothetical protein